MKALLERVRGALPREERRLEPPVHKVMDTRESVASSVSVEPPGPGAARASVVQALRQHLAEVSQGRLTVPEVHEEAQLFDRGYLDSFSYVEFLVFIEHRYGVRIDDSQLAGHLNTIAAMADHIVQKQSSSTD